MIKPSRHTSKRARIDTSVLALATALVWLMAATAQADSHAATPDRPALPAFPPSPLLLRPAPQQSPPYGLRPGNPPPPGIAPGYAPPPRGQQSSLVTDESIPPRLLNHVPPHYPPQARREGKQGTVLLRLEVMEHGAVSRVELLSSSGHEMLDSAAIAAVRGWRYAPVRQGGKPIRWAGRLPVNFVLD